ncbi:MAG: hypothetical protein V3U65_10385 [Granulosicoccaceae bacterium]
MKNSYLLALIMLMPFGASAATVPFDLTVTGEQFDIHKNLTLSDVGEDATSINFDFVDSDGKKFAFDLQYNALPNNRSYPTNLDITIKDGQGNKLGYLFWANNGVKALQNMGVFGLIVDVDGKPVDFKFSFDSSKKGTLRVADLDEERFVQDTLISKFGFQMIRPVIVPIVAEGTRSQTYALDDHPYAVNYTLQDIENGQVEFQYNFYRTNGDINHLLERVYYHADSLSSLRDGMFAGKFFDRDAGTVKLVYYPTLGQTQPPK